MGKLPIDADRFQGCVLGLALGDALGAPFEGGWLERLTWRLIGRTRAGEARWTDDTQMSIDVIESLLANGRINPDDLALRFVASYRWSRGYGPGTARVLKRISRGADWRTASRSLHRDGSYGNGAAMRAPVVGLFYANRVGELDEAARQSAVVTHAHPLGIEGAILITRAAAAAVRGDAALAILRFAAEASESEEFLSRIAVAGDWLESRRDIGLAEVRDQLGRGIAAHESCVTALYFALRFRDGGFAEMQRMIASLGGDADTIGAMSGAIWGAANGVAGLPADLLQKLEQRRRLSALAADLYHRSQTQ